MRRRPMVTETNEQPREQPGEYWRKKEWSFLDKVKTLIHLKKIDPDLLELIKRVAWELANLYPYSDLAKATTKSPTKNQPNPVHGYILLHYPLLYRKLIFDNRVIDLACLYARRNFNPTILTTVPLEELKKYRKSLVFIDPYTLKNYPMVLFNKLVVFTLKEFYDSIAQENDAEITWKGWDTTGIRLPLNASLMSFVSYDIPMWFVTHTPGKHVMYYEADFEDIEKQHQKELILTKAYHQAQIELAQTRKILDKTKGVAESYGRMLSDALKEANRQRKKDFRSEINRIEQEKEEQRIRLTQKPSKLKQLLPLFITIAIITGSIIFLLLFLGFTQGSALPTNSTTPMGFIGKLIQNGFNRVI